MIQRLLLTMLLALTGRMVAIVPVAAMEMYGPLGCLERSVSAPAGEHVRQAPVLHHEGHGQAESHEHQAAGPVVSDDAPRSTDLPLCCDVGCVYDASVFASQVITVEAMTRVLPSWNGSDRADLARLFVMRRPPRA